MTELGRHSSLEELQAEYPGHWKKVKDAMEVAVRESDNVRLDELVRPVLPAARNAKIPSKKELNNLKDKLIEQRLAALCIQTYLKHSFSDGVIQQSVTLFDRLIYRILLFDKRCRRKIVNRHLFKMLWPLVKNPNLLLPMAESRGIYGFHSKELLKGLVEIIGNRKCLEIGAGDGALSASLSQMNVDITASDDYSWSDRIKFGATVHKADAKTALETFSPDVVICSWPPPLNNFESYVFATNAVQTYIVIGGYGPNHFGNWGEYKRQENFSMINEERLAPYFFPPDLNCRVYVFNRVKDDALIHAKL